MSESIIIKPDVGNKTLADIQAEVAAFEANPVDPGAPDASTPSAENAPAAVKPQAKDALPEPGQTPPAEEKAPEQQPKETTEKAATETPKAAEPVKETDWKAAYQSLQRKFNKAFVEKKAEPQPVETPKAVEPVHDVGYGDLSPEGEKRLLADLDKAPAKTLVSLIREITRNEINPIRSKVEAADFERQEIAKLSGLERLANEGHEWLKTEDGLRKMETALTENPELWNSKDPYRAALGFIPDVPLKAGRRGQAQATGLTPILGAGVAMPTVVSAPAVSKVDKLQGIMADIEKALARGNVKRAQELQAQADEIDRE